MTTLIRIFCRRRNDEDYEAFLISPGLSFDDLERAFANRFGEATTTRGKLFLLSENDRVRIRGLEYLKENDKVLYEPNAAPQGTCHRPGDRTVNTDENRNEEQDQVAKPKIGEKYFVKDNDIEYPVRVAAPPRAQKQDKGSCYVKWIGYAGGKVVKDSDLLPWTEERENAYKEKCDRRQNHERAKREKQQQKEERVRKRKANERKIARAQKKQARMEQDERNRRALDVMHGPPTDASDLDQVEMGEEGTWVRQVSKKRIVYFAIDDETIKMIAAKFPYINVDKLLYDNKPIHDGLTMCKRFKPCAKIVMPISWYARPFKPSNVNNSSV